jgi:hypothetical protein
MNVRSEEKERQYGPFVESIVSISVIASELTRKEITPEDVCKVLIALKVGRLRHNIKDDTLVDAAAYLDGLQKVRDMKKEKI